VTWAFDWPVPVFDRLVFDKLPGMTRLAVVTGCAGFVGSHLTDRLLRDGWAVVGVDNLWTGQRSNVAHLAQHQRFVLLVRDVREPLGDLDADAVIHLACPASPADYQADQVGTLLTGGLGTWHALELASQRHARFVLASTSEVYGDPLVHPQPETYTGNVEPVGPRSCYDEAKRYAEALTVAYQRRGLSTGIARIFNTYGPRMRPTDGRVVPQLIGQALAGEPLTVQGDGSQTRSFCYVDDLVDGLVALLETHVHGPVNLGNPQEVTVTELAELIRHLTGTDSPLVHTDRPPGDPQRRRPDISLARELLDWTPRVSLADGLAETIEQARAASDAITAWSVQGRAPW